MPGRTHLFTVAVLAAVATGTVAGCGQSEGPSRPVEKPGAKPKPAPAATPVQERAADPADDLSRFVSDLAAGRADAVYAALPDQYRKDLGRFLGETVRPIEADARRRTAEAVARFADMLREKEDLVLASDRFEIAGPAAEVLRSRFGSVCRLFAATARWPGWSEPGAGDAKSLVAAVVSAVAADPQLAAELRSLRLETVSVAGDAATVRVRAEGETRGRELSFVRVDDAWVPKALAERWPTMVPAAGPAGTTDRAADLSTFAERLDDVTAALANVRTQAEFDALAEKAATLLLATAAGAEREPRAVRPDEFVTVEVRGPLTNEQKDRIVWELASRTDAPPSGLADAVDVADGEGIVVTVGPVADVQAFAKRLSELKVEGVDAEQKKITARVAGP